MLQTYLLTSAVILIASTVAGLAGFGAMIISVPLLAIFLDIKTVVPLTILASLSIHFLILIQLRRHFEFHNVQPLLIGALPGIVIGVALLKIMNKEILQIILGITLVLYSIYGFIFQGRSFNIKKTWGYLFGFLSGYLGGAIGAGGPPVIVYTSLRPWSKDLIKATLQGYFILAGCLVIFGQGLIGLIDIFVLKHYLVALPALVIGTYIGSRFYSITREDIYRKIILAFLIVLGGLLIYRSFF